MTQSELELIVGRFDRLDARINTFEVNLERRFEIIEGRLQKIEARLAKIESDIKELRAELGMYHRELIHTIGRVTDLENVKQA